MQKQLNLYLTLPPPEQQTYNQIHSLVDKYAVHFDKKPYKEKHQVYRNILQCRSYEGATKFILEHQLHRIRGDSSVRDIAEVMVVMANQAELQVKKKIDFLSQHPLKIEAAFQLLVRLNLPMITMGKSTKMADKLTKRMGKKTATYHSKIRSRHVTEDLLVKYGITAPTKGFEERKTATLFGKPVHRKIKCSPDRLKLLYERALRDRNLHCINSTSGFYTQYAQVGLVLSRSDSPTEYSQRVQSIFYGGTLINLVLDKTSEVKWLQKSQRGQRVIDVYSIEELLNVFEND